MDSTAKTATASVHQGVGYFLRKTAAATTPVLSLEYSHDDGSYTLTTSTTLRTIRLVFRLGEEFNEERADGTQVKSVLKLNGNVLIHTQTDPKGKVATILREFGPTQMIATSTVAGWDGRCQRIYEAI